MEIKLGPPRKQSSTLSFALMVTNHYCVKHLRKILNRLDLQNLNQTIAEKYGAIDIQIEN